MALIDDAFALIAPSFRLLGFIVPDVTIEEVHNDRLTITDHPVEDGSTISDHAFKNPVEVDMRIGFSDSTAGFSGAVKLAYIELLALQAAREPFDVFTGKRAYSNMLIRSLTVVTDGKSENALMVACGLREVLIVNTQVTQAPSSAQRDPARTASPAEAGTKQALPQAAFAPTGV